MIMDKKGFTLVELLAVIVILIIIMLIAITSINKSIERARVKAFIADSISIEKGALSKYASDRMAGKFKDDVMNGTVPGHVYYSIEDSIIGDYVEKSDEEYTGIVEVCYALDCEYDTKIWITNGEYYVEGAEGEVKQSQIATEFSDDYETMINSAPAKDDTFNFTGDIQRYIAAKDGTYKLEVWGAQGGAFESTPGGYGGYSVSEVNLSKGDILYVVVGGKGENAKNEGFAQGGYNGGGSFNFNTSRSAAGGGATHIALVTGLLNEITEDNVLITAGGGGASRSEEGACGTSVKNVKGESATAVKSSSKAYSFGKAADSTSYNDTPSGGGFYATTPTGCGGGLGGLSYVGSPYTSNGKMYVYGYSDNLTAENMIINTTGNSSYVDKTACPAGFDVRPISKCAKSGDGYAKITFIG